MPGSEKSRLELNELLKLLQAIQEPSKYYIISSSAKPAKKLEGLTKIWAWVVPGIWLFTTSFSSDQVLPATSGTRSSSSYSVDMSRKHATHRC